MKRLLKWFRKPSALGRTPSRHPESFRPQLEALETREVPAQISAASFYVGDGTDAAMVGIEPTTHTPLVFDQNLHDDFALRELPGATAVSMGPTGNVFVLNSNGTLTGVSIAYAGVNTSWRDITLGGWSSEISAGQGSGGLVFAIGTGGVVYVNSINSPGWADMGDPLGKPVSHISAGLDANGKDVVFAIGSDGHIYGHDANWDRPGSRWYLVDNSATFTQLSATPHNQVYAIDQSGKLHEAFLHSYWGLFSLWQDGALSPPSRNPVIALSAASYSYPSYSEVYVIDTNHNAYQYNSYSGWNAQMVDSDVSEIAAAGGAYGNEFYDVHDGQVYFSYWGNHYIFSYGRVL